VSGKAHNPIDVVSETDTKGEVRFASIRFGPHYIVEVRQDGPKVSFSLVYTHHGFAADASEVNGELESIINEVRRTRPEAVID
jgi:hypothetical protein